MGQKENKMRHDFIVSNYSPDGFWLIEVPVGIFEENRGNKRIDAVCFPDLVDRYPDSFAENDDMISLIDVDPHPENVTRAELFRRLIKEKDFSTDTAIIYEFKTEGQSLFKGVGQLTVCASLFKRDWSSRIKSKQLVTENRDYLIDLASRDIDTQIEHYNP